MPSYPSFKGQLLLSKICPTNHRAPNPPIYEPVKTNRRCDRLSALDGKGRIAIRGSLCEKTDALICFDYTMDKLDRLGW